MSSIQCQKGEGKLCYCARCRSDEYRARFRDIVKNAEREYNEMRSMKMQDGLEFVGSLELWAQLMSKHNM